MLSSNVLVLNRHFQPVHITSVRRAFSLLYMGVARVIEPDFSMFDFASWRELAIASEEESVHTIDRAIRIPRVIILQLYDRLPKTRVRFSRFNIYARDSNTCQYCGHSFPRVQLNLDHVTPRARGGRTTWENVVCCCIPCNVKKGAKLPHEAGMRLLKKPVRPAWTPNYRPPPGIATHPEWKPFLGLVEASYWNVELADD